MLCGLNSSFFYRYFHSHCDIPIRYFPFQHSFTYPDSTYQYIVPIFPAPQNPLGMLSTNVSECFLPYPGDDQMKTPSPKNFTAGIRASADWYFPHSSQEPNTPRSMP